MGTKPRPSRIATGVDHLCAVEPRFAPLRDDHGLPELKGQRDPYLAIGRAIMYQQLAGSAARAIHGRFVDLFGGSFPEPKALAKTPIEDMRAVGLSRPKASYLQNLAEYFAGQGATSREALRRWPDDDVIGALTSIKGVGRWTVDMYLLFGLRRMDTLPVGDYGVRVGFRKFFKLSELPKPAAMVQRSQAWRPYRGLASWYMWRLAEQRD